MPSYTFKPRFIPFLKDFTKRGTIRKIRNHPPRVGQMVSHFAGPRFKPQRVIEKQPCTAVDTLIFLESGEIYRIEAHALNQPDADHMLDYIQQLQPVDLVTINGITAKKLSDREKNLLAWQDGFRTENTTGGDVIEGCFDLMLRWWKQTHSLPFAGHHTKW